MEIKITAYIMPSTFVTTLLGRGPLAVCVEYNGQEYEVPLKQNEDPKEKAKEFIEKITAINNSLNGSLV